jgi:hypothetical protein
VPYDGWQDPRDVDGAGVPAGYDRGGEPLDYGGPETPFSYVAPQEPPGYVLPQDVPAYADMGEPSAYDGPDTPLSHDGPGASLAYGIAEPPAYREAAEPAYRAAAEPAYRAAEQPAAYNGLGQPPDYGSAGKPAAYYGSQWETGEPRDYDGAGEAGPYATAEEPSASAATGPLGGPFEPPPGQPRPHELADAEPGGDPAPYERLVEAGPVASVGGETPAFGGGYGDADSDSGRSASEEKLEQIKDLYMTVEAIGDDNVDKHFDELMRRQRELISEYFKETGIGTGKTGAAQNGNAADAT